MLSRRTRLNKSNSNIKYSARLVSWWFNLDSSEPWKCELEMISLKSQPSSRLFLHRLAQWHQLIRFFFSTITFPQVNSIFCKCDWSTQIWSSNYMWELATLWMMEWNMFWIYLFPENLCQLSPLYNIKSKSLLNEIILNPHCLF